MELGLAGTPEPCTLPTYTARAARVRAVRASRARDREKMRTRGATEKKRFRFLKRSDFADREVISLCVMRTRGAIFVLIRFSCL